MSEPVRILIVEDAPTDFELAQREIRKAVNDCVFQQAQTQEDFLRALDDFQPDLILSDYQMPRFDGLTALKLAQEHAKLTPFIIWTGTMGEDVAVELMRSGAANYLLKDNLKRLGPAVAHALEERRLLLEHKQAEETIYNNEKRFRALIENGRDNISLLAVDGTLLWESPATVRGLGYAQDEFVGHNIFELMHPDDLKWISDLYVKLIQEPGSRQDGVFRLRHRDGSWRWNEATVTNMLDQAGVNAIVANYRDITERKQAEERLEEERNLLRTLIDNLPDRIFAMDMQGRKTLSNTADWRASGGETMEDVLGKTDFDTYPPELAQEFWALDKAVLDSGEPVINYEEPGLDAEGKPVWVLSTKVPLRDNEGKVAGLVGIGRDITNLKRVEMERQALLEIMQGLANTDDLQEFLKFIHHSIASVIYAENFFVVFYNQDTGLFEEIYSVDKYDEPAPPSALEKSITSYVFRRGEPLLLTQARFDELVEQGEVELVGTDSDSWLGVPLKTQNGTIGVIAVQDYENSKRYTEHDKDFLALIGSQVALAIERKQAEAELRSSQERFRQLADNIQEAFWITDAESGKEIYLSPAAETIWGRPLEELMHQPYAFMDNIVLEDRPRILAALEQQKNGQKIEIEYRIMRLDGSVHWIWDRSFPILDGAGRVSSVAGITADITEGKQAEAEIRHHLIELEALYENGLAVGRLLEPREIGEQIIETFSRHLSWHHVTIRLRRDKSDDLELIAFNLPDMDGKKSSDAERSFISHVRKVGEGMSGWVVQTGKSIRTGNLHEHAQYVHTFEGMQSGLYMPLKIADRVIGVISVESEESDAFTAQDERLLATLANQAAVAFENARLYHSTQQELSERMRAEELLAHERNLLAQRVEERTSDLSRVNSNLARALRVKDEFLANMSHELRTPLNAILGLSESLGEQIAGPLNEKQLKYITTISESGHHLLSLINDILDLAKIEAGQITLDVNKVDINSVCQASLRMIKQLAQKKNQDVTLKIDDGISLMWADERRLKQMIVNLLGNAVKFTPEDGNIGLEVHANRNENKVAITVWDNGIGIKEDDLPQLFQPFVQLDAGIARGASGTGLGLALVSQMARLHGGGVSASSQPGKGSSFTIVLPWEPALAAETESRLKSTGKFRAVDPNAENKRTILLIEDTEEVTMMLRDYLELAGYKVFTAQDGLDGITQAKLNQPDLILMDIQMPRMDGFETTQRLRNDPEFKYTPIIALTALAMSNDRERCLAAGMDEYISKPVNLKALVKIIQGFLSKIEATRS